MEVLHHINTIRYRIRHYYPLIRFHFSPSISVQKLLADWEYLAEIAGLPEFNACTTAVHNWSKEIINSFGVPHPNGYTEGCNNKIKVLKCVCFGVRNIRRFRNRILHCAA